MTYLTRAIPTGASGTTAGSPPGARALYAEVLKSAVLDLTSTRDRVGGKGAVLRDVADEDLGAVIQHATAKHAIRADEHDAAIPIPIGRNANPKPAA